MHSADHVVMSKSVVHKQNIEVEELAHLHNMIRHTFVRRTCPRGCFFTGGRMVSSSERTGARGVAGTQKRTTLRVLCREHSTCEGPRRPTHIRGVWVVRAVHKS